MIEKALKNTNRKILYFHCFLFLTVTTINYFIFFIANYFNKSYLSNDYSNNDLFILLIILLSLFISIYNFISAKYYDYIEEKNLGDNMNIFFKLFVNLFILALFIYWLVIVIILLNNISILNEKSNKNKIYLILFITDNILFLIYFISFILFCLCNIKNNTENNTPYLRVIE